ncbi:cyclin-A2 [Synchiropus splendidus]|uniref:cyclin-A2 n=1 Tax=Synchiropus splendidus TaxID=270530 RepID=UPI00237E7EE8|nr:cyclin-A2 [Synchiropus splendidus]
MSGVNRGQTSAVSDLHDQENVLSRLRGSTKPRSVENQENVPPKQPAAKTTTRTVLGALQPTQRTKIQNQRGTTKQESSQPLCRHEDVKAHEKPASKASSFQIHVDEPDVPCTRKPVAVKEEPIVEESPLPIDGAVACLRQPLATIDRVAAMEVSFDSPMDMSLMEAEDKPVRVNEAPEYAAEIYSYLRELEERNRPKAGYMKKQPDITNSMRAILVDWLVEVGEEYKLQNETLYLAVNYIDRFLSSMSVLRGKLQLVGTAAMLLAAKFEEIYPPEVAEFVYITDDTYTKKQVLRMEHLVLKVLSFDLAAPTINQFLSQYFTQQPANKQVESLASYLGELSLVDSDPFLKYLPSHTAAAAYTLANFTMTGGSWPKSLTEMSGYSLEDLMPAIVDLHQMFVKAPQHPQQSVREKYKGPKYSEVSQIEAPAELFLK